MLDSLVVRGRAAQVGLPSCDQAVSINILPQLLRGQEYVGCAGGNIVPAQMLPFLIEQQQMGNFPLEEMTSYYKAKTTHQYLKVPDQAKLRRRACSGLDSGIKVEFSNRI